MCRVCHYLLRAALTCQVSGELLWESNARVLVDFGVGAGMFVRSALLLGLKTIAFCFNQDHLRTVTKLLFDWIRMQLVGKNAGIMPSDYNARLEAVRDQRLVAWREKKRPKARGGGASEPEQKKQRSGSVDSALMMTPSKTPDATRHAPSPAASSPSAAFTPATTPTTTPAAAQGATPAATPTPLAASNPVLQKMLTQWGAN